MSARAPSPGGELARAVVACSAVNALTAGLLAVRGGLTDAAGLLANVALGVAIGSATAFLLGIAIQRGHSLGYVLAAALLLVLLVGTAWLANNSELIVITATLAVSASLYAIAAVITCLLVHPVHRDRRRD
jgi:hypothetical protein